VTADSKLLVFSRFRNAWKVAFCFGFGSSSQGIISRILRPSSCLLRLDKRPQSLPARSSASQVARCPSNRIFKPAISLHVRTGGHILAQTLERAPYAALYSRIQVRVQLKPVVERERFCLLIAHALKSAGCQHTLLSDAGMEILRQASKGLPRQAGRILCTAMRLAVPKALNHLPDELLQQAIGELQ